MLKKINNKYIITYREVINQNIQLIKNLPPITELRTTDYAEYEKLMTAIENLPNIKEEYTAAEIFDIDLSGLEIIGRHYDIKNIEMNLRYYIPSGPELLVISAPEAEEYLRAKPNFTLINLFNLHEFAAELRFSIARPVSSNLLVQKHGLVPVSGFETIRPRNSIIIRVPATSYFTTNHLFKIYPETLGLSTKMRKAELIEVQSKFEKPEIIYPETVESIYETYDDIHYRRLETRDKNIKLISAIAAGYNEQLVFPRYEFPDYTYTGMNSDIIERYKSILAKINPERYADSSNDIIDNLISLLMEIEFDRTDKNLMREFRLGVETEKMKFMVFMARSRNFAEFREEVINNQKNFILRFQKKIKIYEYAKKIGRTSAQISTSQN